MNLILDILGSAGFGSLLGGIFGYLTKREERENLQLKMSHEVDMLRAKTAASGIRTASGGVGAVVDTCTTENIADGSNSINLVGVNSKATNCHTKDGFIGIRMAASGTKAIANEIEGYLNRGIDAQPGSVVESLHIKGNDLHDEGVGATQDIILNSNVTYSHVKDNNSHRALGVISLGAGTGNVTGDNII